VPTPARSVRRFILSDMTTGACLPGVQWTATAVKMLRGRKMHSTTPLPPCSSAAAADDDSDDDDDDGGRYCSVVVSTANELLITSYSILTRERSS